MQTIEKRAPLASLEDFSSIYHLSPKLNNKLSNFSTTPLLSKTQNGNLTLVENHDESMNVHNFVKFNEGGRKLRPLVKVPQDRSTLNFLDILLRILFMTSNFYQTCA